ncbi:MAG: ATP-dependent protease [Alphaproteobacteria bacterium]|nr:ATP-dependent protease [Alphaproteobacteria bacterium]
MARSFDLPEVVAVFPLPGALLLPRGRLPLHIFEPRYLAMIDDALKTPHRLIGMIQPREVPGGREAGREGGGRRLYAIGCAGRIVQFSETEDGRHMISLAGISRFRMVEEVSGFTPYRRVQVDWSPFARDRGAAEADPGFRRKPFLEMLRRYFEAAGLSADWSGMSEAEDEMLINSLSMLCPFAPEDKQALLEAPSLETRRETLVTLMEFSLRAGDGEERMQ